MTRPAAGAYRDALVEHLGDAQCAAVDAPVPVPTAMPTLIPETQEERDRSARVKRNASIGAERPDTKPPRWGSARAAILDYARHVTYGATAKSPSAIHARLVDEHRPASSTLAPREEPVRYDQSAAVWVTEVARALDAAYEVPWCVHVSPQRVEIPTGYCRTILLLRVCGKPVKQALDRTAGDAPGERAGDTAKAWRHTRIVQWVEQSASQLADDVSGYVGAEVTVGVIGSVVKHGLRSVTTALAGAGLVPEPRRREESESMASNDPGKLAGEKEVAAYLDLGSVSSVREWARKRGLPLRKTPSGRVYAIKAEVDEWRREQEALMQRMAGAR